MRKLASRRGVAACVLGLAATLALGATDARAAPILLYNTGVDDAGVPLPDLTVGDPHYTLISVPGGSTDILIRTQPFTDSYGYLPDNTTSRWIGPRNDDAFNGPSGLYTYRTTFDLTGLDPTTAVITGRWSSDDASPGIYLNGVFTGFSRPVEPPSVFTPFTLTTGFVAGVNTLDFVVDNGPLNNFNPTALRVEMSGTAAEQSAVPEPSACLLIASGAGLLFVRNRRLRQSLADRPAGST